MVGEDERPSKFERLQNHTSFWIEAGRGMQDGGGGRRVVGEDDRPSNGFKITLGSGLKLDGGRRMEAEAGGL